jgi:hypothetical protein
MNLKKRLHFCINRNQIYLVDICFKSKSQFRKQINLSFDKCYCVSVTDGYLILIDSVIRKTNLFQSFTT